MLHIVPTGCSLPVCGRSAVRACHWPSVLAIEQLMKAWHWLAAVLVIIVT